jgi:hypothetical protein
MSMDPVALSAITVGSPHEAEYDAVLAAVTATERGRWFLTEFAARNRTADTHLVIAAIGRIEAAIRGDAPRTSATLWRDLTGIAAEIGRIRDALAAEGTKMPEIASAVERIQDVAFSLRERATDAAMCDALDAAAREISVVRSPQRANGKSAGAPAALLAELAIRVDELIKLSLGGEVPVDQKDRPPPAVVVHQNERGAAMAADREPSSQPNLFAVETAKSGDLAGPVAVLTSSLTNAAIAIGPRGETADPILPPADSPPELEAIQRRHVNGGPRWHIEAPDFLFQPVDSERHNVTELFETSGMTHALLPETQLQSSSDDDPADIFEAAVDPVADAAAAPAVNINSAAEPPSQIRVANGHVVRSIVRPGAGDPLAALRGLSEDELNALFG